MMSVQPETETSITLPIRPNTLNMARIRVRSQENIGAPATILCSLPFSGESLAFQALISSGEKKDHAVSGRWFEHYLFFKSGIMDSAVTFAVQDGGGAIAGDVIPAGIENLAKNGIVHFRHLLARAAALHIPHASGTVPVFYGIQTALDSVASLYAQQSVPPSLAYEAFGSSTQCKAACWGEGFIANLLASAFGYTYIDESALPLIESGFFDLIVLDAPASGTKDAALAHALERSPSPLVFAEGSGGALRFHNNTTGYCEECELSDLTRVAPSVRNSNALKTVAVPCASDCYQYPEFSAILNALPQYGFSIGACEGEYFHNPARTAELFRDADTPIHIFPKLPPEGLLALFRQSGFVLFTPSGIRNPFQQLALASLALYSGSIPVFCCGKAPLPFADILPSFYGIDALARFLREHDDMLLFQKLWLSILRKALALEKGSRLSLLGAFAPPSRDCSPPATVICVSKRPDNLPLILENFSRQRYANVQYHLIWNVHSKMREHCLSLSHAVERDNLRVSVVDEQYNIGTCLNLGIQSSGAKYWFKMDDDDYYGENYITDMVNMYRLTDADAVCKPHAFIALQKGTQLFIRDIWPEKTLSWLAPNEYGCGATLSGRVARDIPLFSVTHRNSCDSHWLEKTLASGNTVFTSDCYNFCVIRHDVTRHTWKISEETLLQRGARLGNFHGGWLHAD